MQFENGTVVLCGTLRTVWFFAVSLPRNRKGREGFHNERKANCIYPRELRLDELRGNEDQKKAPRPTKGEAPKKLRCASG